VSTRIRLYDPDVPEEFFLGQCIPVHYHYNMLRDQARVDSFREAIGCVTARGAKVLELGGGTGILSFFAAQRAAKVWCVEMNPALAKVARRFLADNGVGDQVEVVEADAGEYVPPESVDVVICEMLHSALLREKQVEVIQSFKEHYAQKFPGKLPVFVPEATLLAVQPVEQLFTFAGYHAPVPLFQGPGDEHQDTTALGEPAIYQTVSYERPLPTRIAWQGEAIATQSGHLNAIRFVTKNVLAILVDEQRSIDWNNQHLVLPLRKPLAVERGDAIRIEFNYEAGGSLESLADSLSCQTQSGISLPRRAA
jgi:predicted RNA methylase